MRIRGSVTELVEGDCGICLSKFYNWRWDFVLHQEICGDGYLIVWPEGGFRLYNFPYGIIYGEPL